MSFVGKTLQSIGILPKTPSAPSLPAPSVQAPSVATPAVQAAADSARMRERAASGRASTMLSDQSDASSLTPTTGRTMLGGKLDDQKMGTAKLLGR